MTRHIALLSALTLVIAGCGQTDVSGNLPDAPAAEAPPTADVYRSAMQVAIEDCNTADNQMCRDDVREWMHLGAIAMTAIRSGEYTQPDPTNCSASMDQFEAIFRTYLPDLSAWEASPVGSGANGGMVALSEVGYTEAAAIRSCLS